MMEVEIEGEDQLLLIKIAESFVEEGHQTGSAKVEHLHQERNQKGGEVDLLKDSRKLTGPEVSQIIAMHEMVEIRPTMTIYKVVF